MLITNSSTKSYLTVTIFLFVCATVVQGQNQVKVISNQAKIYTSLNSPAGQSIQAQKGDIFEIEDFDNEWISIRMFSGETRFIEATKVEFINDVSSKDVTRRIKQCDDIQKAQTRAAKQAVSKYPHDVSKQDDNENLLIDKFILTIFRKHNTPTVHNSILLECINDTVGPETVEF